jgi:hypothetical protein
MLQRGGGFIRGRGRRAPNARAHAIKACFEQVLKARIVSRIGAQRQGVARNARVQ